MTVSTVNCRWRYTGDGTSTAFPFDNVIWAAADIDVYLNGVLQSGGYSVTGLGNSNGGNVTFGAAPADATEILLSSAIPLSQLTRFSKGTAFPADATGDALDRVTRLAQQLQAQLGRALQIDITDDDDLGIKLPPAAVRANKILSFGPDGGVSVTTTIPTASVSAPMAAVIAAGTVAQAAGLMRLTQAFSPMQYGAAGDGVTDDADAIEAMMADAAAVAGAGKNCQIDGGNFNFATSRPWVFPSNTIVRNVRTKALPSSHWIARQIPADPSTNGLFHFAPHHINIVCENCVLDVQGVQGGGSPSNYVTNCNGFMVSTGCVGIRLRSCTARNPSAGQALLYSIGDVTAEACSFTAFDTANAPTYTGYPAFFDWYYDVATGVTGAIDSRFLACNFTNGLYQIYIAAGCSQIFFSAGSHWWTAAGGPNGRIGVQCWGHGNRFQDCYHDSVIRYSTGGTYTNAAGSHTQTDVDILICDGKIGTNPALPSLYLQAQAANSTMKRLKWTHGLHYQGNDPSNLINTSTAGGGSWALPAKYLDALGTSQDDVITTAQFLTIYAAGDGLTDTVMAGVTTDAISAYIRLVPGGYTPGYLLSPFLGSYKDDAIMGSADALVTLRVCSANSDAAPASAIMTDLTASGTRLGFRTAWPNNDPNNTVSTFFQSSATGTARYKVFSNGNVVNTNNSYGAISDARTKTDIVTAAPASERLKQLRVTEFTSMFHPDGPRLTSLIAQEVRPVFPEIVGEDGGQLIDENGVLVPNDEDGLPTGPGTPMLFLNLSQLTPFLLQGWQELEQRVAALEGARG